MAGAAGSFSTFSGGHFSGIGSGSSRRHGGSDQEDTNRFARCKPESIEKLCRTTRFSKEELQVIYRGFKQQCPNGFLKEETLKNIFASFFPQGDSSEYAHYVFLTLDNEKTGSISFERFIWALSLLSRGTVEEKLRWIFQLYDVDNDGFLAKDELILVVTSIYHLMGKWTKPTYSIEGVEEHVDHLLKRMNSDSDGYVPYPNFLAYCLGDRTILESMKSLDTFISGGYTTATNAGGGFVSNSSTVASTKPFTIESCIDESPMEALPAYAGDDVFHRLAVSAQESGNSQFGVENPSSSSLLAPFSLSRGRSGTSGSNTSMSKKSRKKSIKDFFD